MGSQENCFGSKMANALKGFFLSISCNIKGKDRIRINTNSKISVKSAILFSFAEN